MNILDRLALLPLIVSFLLYPLLAWPVLRFAGCKWRMPMFAAVNAAGMLALMFGETVQNVPPSLQSYKHYVTFVLGLFFAYAAFALISYGALRWGAGAWEQRGWTAFAVPLVFLVLVKYCPLVWEPFHQTLATYGGLHLMFFFIGLSYVAFRLSHLVREVQNGVTKMPSTSEYLAFAFFVPTASTGPISPYSKMSASLAQWKGDSIGDVQAWLRILVGLTKYIFFASLLNQFTYSGWLLDGHPHRRSDLLIAVFAYTLFLYCNFSGFCDMAIGISAALGVEVSENFDNPFLSRNMQVFWNHWHMTLSSWFRDMMFTPLLKQLVRWNGPQSMTHMVPVTVLLVFLTVGLWHGTGLNFALYGLAQGIGIAIVYYYNLLLKRLLKKEAYLAYQKSKVIRAAAVSVTFCYFSASLFLFANTFEDMRRIFKALV